MKGRFPSDRKKQAISPWCFDNSIRLEKKQETKVKMEFRQDNSHANRASHRSMIVLDSDVPSWNLVNLLGFDRKTIKNAHSRCSDLRLMKNVFLGMIPNMRYERTRVYYKICRMMHFINLFEKYIFKFKFKWLNQLIPIWPRCTIYGRMSCLLYILRSSTRICNVCSISVTFDFSSFCKVLTGHSLH